MTNAELRDAKKSEKKLPKTKILTFTVNPEQSFASMAANMEPPAGYFFSRMDRKRTKARITYVRIDS